MEYRGCDYTVGPLRGGKAWRWTFYDGVGSGAKPVESGDTTGHERVAKQAAIAAIDVWRKTNKE